MSFAILWPAYSLKVRNVRAGLSYHLACEVLRLRPLARARGIPLYVASTEGEDVRGLWERIRSVFGPEEIILLEDDTEAFAAAAQRLLAQHDRLVVHAQSTRQLLALEPLRRAHPGRVHTVYTVHSFRNASWKAKPYSWVMGRRLKALADYTIFLSPAAMREFVGSSRLLRNGRAGLMPLGAEHWAEWESLEPQAGDLDATTEQVLRRPDAFRFIYLAAFKGGKGHVWMVEAVAEALRRHRHAYIVLAGWGEEHIRTQVRALARRLDIADQIVLAGSVGREFVPWVLAHCEAAIVPSISETFGQCVIEPMTAGLPVVGTRKGVSSWLVMDYDTGLGVEYGDRAGLGRAVDYLVSHPEEAAAMGRNAKRIARTVFDWQRVAECHVRIYTALAEGRCAAAAVPAGAQGVGAGAS